MLYRKYKTDIDDFIYFVLRTMNSYYIEIAHLFYDKINLSGIRYFRRMFSMIFIGEFSVPYGKYTCLLIIKFLSSSL